MQLKVRLHAPYENSEHTLHLSVEVNVSTARHPAPSVSKLWESPSKGNIGEKF